jgi:hypothetical protein
MEFVVVCLLLALGRICPILHPQFVLISICSANLSSYSSDASVKQCSVFSSSYLGEQGSPSQRNGSSSARTLPPTTLNIVAGNSVMDIENGSENGELTPIVSPRNDFVDYDDNFETASDGEDGNDDDDSIEVIEEDQDDVSVNQQTKPESITLPLNSFSGENLKDFRTGIDVVVGVLCDNSGAKISDKENELEICCEGTVKEKISEIDAKYYEWKEAGSLGIIKFDGSEELSVISDSAEPMYKDNLDDTDEVMLVTSTPAAGKRLARKRVSRDLDEKSETGMVKKFVDGSYVGFGKHRDGSNLGKMRFAFCFILW